MRRGLNAAVGNRSREAGESPGIFLFTSKEAAHDAVCNWLGDYFEEDEPLCLLEINAEGLSLSVTADYERVSRQTISPDRIKVLNTDY